MMSPGAENAEAFSWESPGDDDAAGRGGDTTRRLPPRATPDSDHPETRPHETQSQETQTQQLGLAAASGERCVNCGAALASDQRYCVNCGERRGRPRFTLAEPSVEPLSPVPPPPGSPRRPRASAGFTLIAGIATLLLAMGVGVLIGHNSAGTQAAAPAAPVKIDLTGAGAGAASAAGAATSSTAAATSAAAAHASAAPAHTHVNARQAAKNVKSRPTAAQVTNAATAAGKVLGGGAATAPATVTSGASCQSGSAGCENGKFTGNFFGN